MCRLPALESAYNLALITMIVYHQRWQLWGGRKGRGRRPGPGLTSVTGAYTQPEHRQILRKTGKDFPISPLTFYDNSYFQMKGEKSQERNSQMSQKGKKKKSLKRILGEKLFYFKSFEAVKCHVFHTFSILFFQIFLVCLTFVRWQPFCISNWMLQDL